MNCSTCRTRISPHRLFQLEWCNSIQCFDCGIHLKRRSNLHLLIYGLAGSVYLLLVNVFQLLTYDLWQLLGIQIAFYGLAFWVDSNTVQFVRLETRNS